MALTTNTIVPDFTLKDQNENQLRLSTLRGKKVLLSFRPLAWTPVCRDQMKRLDNNYERFQELNTIPLGIGVDSSPSNKAWAESMGIKHLHILSDFWPHGAVARSYGLFREEDGFSERANVVIDESGKAVFVKIYPTSDLPDLEEVMAFLKS
jgi:peroxiredoxin